MISITLEKFIEKFCDQTIEGFCIVKSATIDEIQATVDWQQVCHIKQIGEFEYKVWSIKSWRQSPEYREAKREEIKVESVTQTRTVKSVMDKIEKLKKAGLTKSQIKLLGEDIL